MIDWTAAPASRWRIEGDHRQALRRKRICALPPVGGFRLPPHLVPPRRIRLRIRVEAMADREALAEIVERCVFRRQQRDRFITDFAQQPREARRIEQGEMPRRLEPPPLWPQKT